MPDTDASTASSPSPKAGRKSTRLTARWNSALDRLSEAIYAKANIYVVLSVVALLFVLAYFVGWKYLKHFVKHGKTLSCGVTNNAHAGPASKFDICVEAISSHLFVFHVAFVGMLASVAVVVITRTCMGWLIKNCFDATSKTWDSKHRALGYTVLSRVKDWGALIASGTFAWVLVMLVFAADWILFG